MVDLDHFKGVNDRFGHPAGDEVLRQIASGVRAGLRTMDRPARYGGEELAVILPETLASDAIVVAERLRKSAAARPIAAVGSNGEPVEIAVTLSIGIAGFPEDAGAQDALVRAADQALYQAKAGGRNQTVRYREIAPGS